MDFVVINRPRKSGKNQLLNNVEHEFISYMWSLSFVGQHIVVIKQVDFETQESSTCNATTVDAECFLHLSVAKAEAVFEIQEGEGLGGMGKTREF